MFIELTEFLRCPHHPEGTHLVLAPDEMVGRQVTQGVIGCPVCRREFAIDHGVVLFGEANLPPASPVDPDPDMVHALLGLTNAGGYVVLLGSAAGLGAPLAERIGAHGVAVNAPPAIRPMPALTVVRHGTQIPLRSGMARGVVIGSEYGASAWLTEARRVLLNGLRVVVLREDVNPPDWKPLAVGEGMWVGQKSGDGGAAGRNR